MNVTERFYSRYFGPKGIVTAVGVCLHQQYSGSALALICAAIESMAFIRLPLDRSEVLDYDFIAWVNDYISPDRLGISARELWSIRCRLLDKSLAQQELTQRGHSREVLFSWGKYRISDGLEFRPGTRWHRLMMIRADELYKALFRGAEEYRNSFVALPEKEYVVSKRLNTVFHGDD